MILEETLTGGRQTLPNPTPPPGPPSSIWRSNHKFGLKDFTTICQIGRGAYGVVFKVKCRLDEGVYVLKKIALKHIKTKRNDAHKEVMILKRIRHPNIIRYFASFNDK